MLTRDVNEAHGTDVVSLDVEMRWFDWVSVFRKCYPLVLRCVFYSVLLSVMLSYSLPVYYSGETAILPPQQNQSLASQSLAQIAPLLSLSGAGKDLGLKNPTDLYVALLQSRTVLDNLIQRYHLQDVYDQPRISDARKVLLRHSTIAAGKDGIIRIVIEDRDQHRAVLLANEFTHELYRLNQQFAMTEAGQRRIFFGEEMKKAKNDVSDAEIALKKTQESTGLIQLDSQAKAIISSVATLRAQVAAKEVELRSMELFSTEANPEYSLLKQQISALRAQLQKAESAPISGNGDIMVSTGNVPQAGLEYLRRYRDVQYYEAIFELLAKQYEIAKIDEAKSAPLIQVVDEAVLPDKRSSPNRILILAVGVVVGISLSLVWMFVIESRRRKGLDGIMGENIFQMLWREITGTLT